MSAVKSVEGILGEHVSFSYFIYSVHHEVDIGELNTDQCSY